MASPASGGPKLCDACGQPASKLCAKCKTARYCSAACQTVAWKNGHKAVCVAAPEASAPPRTGNAGLLCTRCQQPYSATGTCCVPHPVHLREDMGGGFFNGTITSAFRCRACGNMYELVSHSRPGGGASEPAIEKGPRWCFSGKHTTGVLSATDQRRVDNTVVALGPGPQLQAQIDALSPDVETLTISATMGFDFEAKYVLNKRLPKLHTLQLIDINFSQVVLTPATTPMLRSLQLQNIQAKCDLQVVLPELRGVTVHYYDAHDKAHVIDTMLKTATKLEVFDSYKMWSNYHLTFASPALRSIYIHRSDSLSSLSIWAPNLTSLKLQGCYNLERIQFPATHELASQLPRGYKCRSPLYVYTENSNLGPEAKAELRAHPRAVKDTRSYGNSMQMPTEALFAAGGAGSDW